MTPRPSRPKPDANQSEVKDALRKVGCVVIDVSALPGSDAENPLDLFVLSPRDWGSPRVWLQVELKSSLDAPFRAHQQTYLNALGVWPFPFQMNPGVPVVAAWQAAEILCKLKVLHQALARSR